MPDPHTPLTADQLIEEMKRLREAAGRRDREIRSNILPLAPSLVEEAPLGFMLMERLDDPGSGIPDLRYLYVNRRFEEIMGVTGEEVLGRHVSELYPGMDADWLKRVLRVAGEGGVDSFQRYSAINDKHFELVLFQPEENRVAAFFRDISPRVEAERAHETSERKYRLIAENAREVISLHDSEGRIVYISPSILPLTGYTPEEYQRLDELENVHPEDLERVQVFAREVLEGDIARTVDWRVRDRDGDYLWMQSRGKRIQRPGDESPTLLVVSREITAQKEAQEALRLSEQRFRMFAESVDDVFWMADADTLSIVYVSPAYERVWKRSVEEAYRDPRSWLEVIHPEDRQEVEERFLGFLQDSEPVDVEYRLLRSDGDIRWIQDHWTLHRGDENNSPLALGIARDVTESRMAQEELKEQELLLRQAQSLAQVGSFVIDLGEGIVTASEEAKRIYGLEGDQWPISLIQRIPVDDDRPRLDKALRDLIQHDIPYDIQFRIRRKSDGDLRHIHSVAVYDERGNRLVGTIQDVTEQRSHQASLRESEERYRLVAETADELIIIHGMDGIIQYVNPAVERHFEISADEMIGRSLGDFVREDQRELMAQRLARREHGDRDLFRYELELPHPDGETIYLELSSVPYRVENDRIESMLIIARDVTERYMDRQRLEEQTRFQETLMDAIPNPIFFKDREGRYLGCNRAFERYTGISLEQMKGKYVEELWPQSQTGVFRNRDRELFEHPGLQEYDHRLTLPDGRERDIVFYKSTFTDSQGRVAGIVGVIADITERNQAELERRRYEERLQQTQKMESLGVLAGGIAHDFNNLLVGILGNAELVLLDLPEDSSARTSIEGIITSASHASDLSRQMLEYSGKSSFVPESVSLAAILQDITRMLRVSIPRSVQLQVALPEDLPAVKGDPSQLKQVFMNLITNAAEAIGGDKGTIEVRGRSAVCSNGDLLGAHGSEAPPTGPCVEVVVADDGPGMDERTRERIFEPFFTTKFTGRGLGLASVLGIVRGHGGAIQVESAPGSGTRFRLHFPVAESPAAEKRDAVPEEARTAQGLILLVDDEQSVRSVASRMLERLGYQVLAAASGEEGLVQLKQNPDRFAAVILDLTMPGMDGLETSREMRRIRADLPIIISSGYSERDILHRFSDDPPQGFIQKPFRLQAVRETVADMLR